MIFEISHGVKEARQQARAVAIAAYMDASPKAAYAPLHHWRTIPWIVINYNPPFIRCARPCICRIRQEKYRGSSWDGIIANLVRDHNESSWAFSRPAWITSCRSIAPRSRLDWGLNFPLDH
ncbi:hypothetical protein HN011_000698 [Eciton burchellii]|nr:hypothetical protein HN011_000698 [Eciton burchellii]